MAFGKIDVVMFFGILSIVFFSILTVVSLIVTVYFLIWCQLAFKAFVEGFFPLVMSTLSLALSIVLVKGLRDKNRRLIKLYLIYGCFLNFSCLAANIIIFACLKDQTYRIVIILPINVIYSTTFFLVMKTYIKYKELRENTRSDDLTINTNQYLILERPAIAL